MAMPWVEKRRQKQSSFCHAKIRVFFTVLIETQEMLLRPVAKE